MAVMRLFKASVLVAVLAGAAMAATYWRYQSLDPCDWMTHDLVMASDLPELVVTAKIRAEFLLEGVTDPDPGQCLFKWWALRRDGLGQEP
ncbi:MAG: hypothetical protein QNJ30_08660 [Kiloniellales bacterium]|nr:hypothetical protein [Kiloniellales bacterium]